MKRDFLPAALDGRIDPKRFLPDYMQFNRADKTILVTQPNGVTPWSISLAED